MTEKYAAVSLEEKTQQMKYLLRHYGLKPDEKEIYLIMRKRLQAKLAAMQKAQEKMLFSQNDKETKRMYGHSSVHAVESRMKSDAEYMSDASFRIDYELGFMPPQPGVINFSQRLDAFQER